jgi:hypothetical protein
LITGGVELMTTESIGYGVRRMCIAADLEHYSRRTDAGQIEAQQAMARLVREAGERGALGRAQWLTQPQGDGELALLPPGIDEAHVVTSLWRQLQDGLHRYNRHANAEARLRMRVAVHEGQTYVADQGFAGDAINTVCRLRDCAEVKDALSAAEGDLVLIVSDRIFYDVIRGFDAHDLPASSFNEVTVTMPDKAFRARAFIFSGGSPRKAPDAAPADRGAASAGQGAAPASSAREAPQPADGHGGAVLNFTGPDMRVRNLAARDINNYGTRDE